MQINISARHGQLSEKTRSKIAAKIDKLSRLFERLMAMDLTVDLEHPENPSVELRVSAEHKHDFVATDQSGDLMGSVDNVLHKLEQQLRKYKEKVQDRHRTPGVRATEAIEPQSDE